VIVAIAMFTAPAQAQSGARCETGAAEAVLDANDMHARVSNNGGLFWNGTRSPYRIVHPDTIGLVFSTSLIFGGMMDGELRTAATAYGPWEFWPGPVQTGDPASWDCRPYDRIWTIERSDLERLDATGLATPDIAEWPWQLGAPVIDGDGNPDNYELQAGDRPELLGDQTAWWIMNDAAGPHETTGSDAIGLEVRASAFALYGSGVIDPELGNAFDDFVGSDTTLGLGYVYNRDAVDDSIGTDQPPPAVGFLILDSPGVHTRESHSDGSINLSDSAFMTGFITFTNGGGVTGTPRAASDFYNYMQARWKDGIPVTEGFDGRYTGAPTSFMYPADPPGYWSNFPTGVSCDPWPCYADQDARFILGSGPFSLTPGATVDFTFAIVYGQGADHLDSVQELKKNARIIKDLGQALLQPTYERQAPDPEPPHTDFGISDPWPNPATGLATIEFDVRESMDADIRLFDMLGREIRTLLSERRAAGPGTVTICTNDLPPGSYLIRARFGFHRTTREILVVK